MTVRIPVPQTSSLPSISVAIATYKGEKHLREQLQSIARQTLLPLEVVITDDQSPDGTLRVAEDFASTAPFPVHVYSNPERLRYADNFLRSASLCKGDLIAFCDQDDLWLEQKLETCVQYFKDPAVQLVCHSAQTFTGEMELGYQFPEFKRTQVLSRGHCNRFENRPGFAMVLRRELLSYIPAAERPKRMYSHDHWVWFLASSVGTVVKIADVLCLYRQHENNVFGAQRHTLGKKLQFAAEIPGYRDLSEAEIACSQLLSAHVEDFPVALQAAVVESARTLALRSKLHALRATLYSQGLTFAARLKLFTRLMIMGGYFPDRSKSRLGPKAALKDLLLGVVGVRRGQLPSKA